MCFKNIKNIKLTFKFSKYVTILIYLVRVVALRYSLVCSQTFLYTLILNNILGPYKQKEKS